MDEGDAKVGNLLIIHALYLRGIVFLDILATRILAHLFITGMKITPLREASNTQVVLIVVKEFFEAGFRHIGQFDFGLTGGGGSLIALSNILLATSGSLNHLVDSAVAALEIVLGEVVGDIINHLGDLIDTEVAVMSVLGEEGVGGSLGFLISRSVLSILNIRIILTILIILIHSFVFYFFFNSLPTTLLTKVRSLQRRAARKSSNNRVL